MSPIIPSAAPAEATLKEHPHFGPIGPDLHAFLARFPACDSPPARTLVLASEERAGSEYLCQMLGATGVLGRPSEYLNTYWMRRFLPDWPEAVPAQIALAWRTGTTANLCFAIKLHWPQLVRLASGMDPAQALPCPIFVRLMRRDMLGQAISLYRARQSGQYHAGFPAERPVEYDGTGISARLVELARHRATWQAYLAANAVVPLEIAYEDLARDPWPALEAIAWAMEQTITRAVIRPAKSLAVQRDATNEAWRARFLAEESGLGRLPNV